MAEQTSRDTPVEVDLGRQRSGATILLVDDNPVVLLKTAMLLRRAGCTVMESTTGGDGIVAAEREKPDLVLLDVMLPDINGLEVCRRLKATPSLVNTFVVLLSYVETSSDRQVLGLEAGADGYIARPIESKELVARVQSLLRIQQAESALRLAHADLERRVTERTLELSHANRALREEIEVRRQREDEIRVSREELRALAMRLVEVQEEERRFIAHELHDEVGQLLTNLKILLDLALRQSGEASRQLTEQSVGLASELLDRVRQMSLNLRPQMLDDFGLLPALEWLFKRHEKQTGMCVHFKHSRLPGKASKPLETAVYRIIQEALTNVTRHAGVKEVTVRLWCDSEALGMQVEDQGAGFDVDEVLARGSSCGLAGMRERALMLGGQFTVESSRGSGCILTIELPLRSASPNPRRNPDPD